jgi:hypothetical protein
MRYSEIIPKRVMGVAQFHLNSNAGESSGWQTINIDTETSYNDLGITLSSYQLSVPAGKYLVSFAQSPVRCKWTLMALYDVTNSAYIDGSQTCTTYHNSGGGTFADLCFQPGVIVELTETTVIEVRGWYNAATTQAGHATGPNGYPMNVSFMRFAE